MYLCRPKCDCVDTGPIYADPSTTCADAGLAGADAGCIHANPSRSTQTQGLLVWTCALAERTKAHLCRRRPRSRESKCVRADIDPISMNHSAFVQIQALSVRIQARLCGQRPSLYGPQVQPSRTRSLQVQTQPAFAQIQVHPCEN